ncbi:MAG: type II secretion system F family protein [Magnetococcales bacterium]|nr:type II secretion system F family protein [Magnetococcales bacterium]
MASNATNVMIFTHQVASMLRSHVPLIAILKNLAKETANKKLRLVIEKVSIDVNNGSDFGDSLAKHPNFFDDIFVNVAKAGMKSGNLAESLTQISEYLEKKDNMHRKLIKAVSYPIILGVTLLAAANIMFFYVLPRFQTIFESFEKELPLPTQILIAIGNFWRDNWYFIFFCILAVSLGWGLWITSKKGRYKWDRFKLKIFFIGRLWRLSALTRFLRTFSVQLHNEVDFLESLRLAAHSCGNRYMEEALFLIENEISRGTGIAKSFETNELFSGIVLQMIDSGEQSGALDELLLSAADYFERVLDSEIEVITGLVNPILTVVIGLALAGMMIASFLPVFELGNVI